MTTSASLIVSLIIISFDDFFLSKNGRIRCSKITWDRRTGGRTDERSGGQSNGRTDGPTDGPRDGPTDGLTDGPMDGLTDKTFHRAA